MFGLDIFYNRLNGDLRDTMDDRLNDLIRGLLTYQYQYYYRVDAETLSFPSYVNIPAMAGLNTGVSLNENLKLYAEAGLGVNFSKITNWNIEWDLVGDRDRKSFTAKTAFDSSFKFAYALEGGIVVQDRYTVGLRYNNLGSNKYKYRINTDDVYDIKGKFSRALSITNLTLAFGVLF